MVPVQVLAPIVGVGPINIRIINRLRIPMGLLQNANDKAQTRRRASADVGWSALLGIDALPKVGIGRLVGSTATYIRVRLVMTTAVSTRAE